MNRKGITTIVAIVLVYVFSCTPALGAYNFDGWPVETRVNGTVNGGVFIDYEPWDGSRDLSLATAMPNGTVKWAHLYTGIWGGREYYKGWVNVTFNGVADQKGLGPIHLQGEDDTNQHVWCTTHGKYWMFYNVTGLVDAGTLNTARVRKINETYGAFDGRVYGIVLIVIYEDGDDPKNIQYWINDGNDAFHYADATWPPVAHDTGTAYFDGTVDVANVTRANLAVVHLTAYDPICSNCLQFNNNPLNTSMVDSNTFELNTWDLTDYVAASGNHAWYTRGEDTYINVPLAILLLTQEEDTFDTGSPESLYPSISGTHTGSIKVDTNITVSRLYTYPCPGTGGHTEFIRIWNETTGDCVEGHWNGYQGDYLTISFNRSIPLKKGVTYHYVIQTGSYPQIHHQKELAVDGGTVSCTKFTDANGREHDNWIPAFILD